MARIHNFPERGARVADWVARLLVETGMSAGEFAFKVGADKRDVQRLLNDRNIGWRLEDKIAAAYGWDFVEAVMTPVVGADPITARENEIEQRLTEAAALHARLERERSARGAPKDPGGLVPVHRGALGIRVSPPSGRRRAYGDQASAAAAL